MKEYSVTIGDQKIIITPDELAEQAGGSIMIRLGDTVLLSTATMSKQKKDDVDFLPLTVDFEKKSYAAGKIIGSRYSKREGKPTDDAVISSRLIDRAIRPLFSDSLIGYEIQVIATCLSWDAENDADILGLIAASTALMISDIPFNGAVGAVRVGEKDGKIILNPKYEDRVESKLDLVFAGVKDGDSILINMIDGELKEAEESLLLEAANVAEEAIIKICNIQEEIAKEFGKEKVTIKTEESDSALYEKMKSQVGDSLKNALFSKDKFLINEIETSLRELTDDQRAISSFIDKESSRAIKRGVLDRGERVDGRGVDELRELDARVALLPRTHGSGLFARGQTKSLSIVTLGAPGDHQLFQEMESSGEKRFMHHYNFPPYSVGEARPVRGPSRRDIGHGMLVEKALMPVLPEFEDFPYTIRVVSEIVSSNGSTSMASVCAASLALMDAGVAIKRPVAGISIGIIADEESGDYRLITDIQGVEDHYGGMDFKVAGTVKGLTAIQMDVKIRGISLKIFSEALDQAKKTRYKILEKIESVLPAPRETISPYAPRVITFQIETEKIRDVIGPGGRVINEIIDETGAEIEIKDSGVVFVSSDKEESAWRAVSLIKNIVREVEVGEIFKGKVKRILDFGAFVEVLPNQEGMIHISKLANYRVEKVTDVVKVGDTVSVKVIGIDEQGRIDLSLKDVPQID